MKGKLSAALAASAVALGAYRVRKPKPLGIRYSDAPTKVLVVGGGFGGLAAVRELARAFGGGRDVGVALLDRVNYMTFWPMVPAVISGDIEVRHVASSIRRILKPSGAQFFQAEVVGVDFDAREVRTDVGPFSYDYLILAPGSRTAYFGASGARENAIDLKGLREALQLRNTVIDRFEEAERLRGELPEGLLTFVFVGAGTTGVEAAADTHDLIFGVLEGDYPNVDFEKARVVLVNAGDHILKGIDPSLVHAATRRLAAQRIEIINDVRAKEIRPDAVVLSDGAYHTDSHHNLGRGDRTPSAGRKPGRTEGSSRTHPCRRIPSRKGQARSLRRRRLHQHRLRRSAGTRSGPSRRAGGQEGGAEPSSGDQGRGACSFQLPLFGSARRPGGRQRPRRHPGRQGQWTGRFADLERSLPL
jgi:Pyridine nucleotide-disulphide oxidoreductase